MPDDATDVVGIESPSDFHGDSSVALTFKVTPDEVRAFRVVSNTAWEHPEDLKAVPYASDLVGGDTTMRTDPVFQIPIGALTIEQNGPKDKNRRYAFDENTRRVYFYRCTW